MNIRRFLFACTLIGAIGNAVPSLAQVHPQPTGLGVIEDDLVGSGLELRDDRPARLAIKRLGDDDRPEATGNAYRAMRAAQNELRKRDPHLAADLDAAFPLTYRDDTVGTMIRHGSTIRFNRTYVLSLTHDQLVDHLWQLAATLQTVY